MVHCCVQGTCTEARRTDAQCPGIVIIMGSLASSRFRAMLDDALADSQLESALYGFCHVLDPDRDVILQPSCKTPVACAISINT